MTELIHIDGKPFVLVPMHDYRRLVNGEREVKTDLPSEIMDKIVARSDHPVKILRKYRALTQMALADAAGLSRPYLTEIETGKKAGSIAALKALAEALGVNPGILI